MDTSFSDSTPDDSSYNCSTLTPRDKEEIIFTTKLVFASIGIVVNFIAIVMLVIFKSYVLLIFRIVLYIMIANMLQVCMQLIELFPIINEGSHNQVRDGQGWTSACRSFGFLDQVTVWMGHISVLWLVFYFVYLIKKEQMPITKAVGRREIIGIGVCFLVPFVFNWIPFSNDYYGFSGSWCWIKLTQKACDDKNINVGLAYILVLHYIPLLFFVLINTIACLLLFGVTCRMQKLAKELVFVIIYPLSYNLLFIVSCISRLDSTVQIQHGKEQLFALWIAHSVADPSRIIVPAILALFMLPFTRKVLKNFKRGEMEPLNSTT